MNEFDERLKLTIAKNPEFIINAVKKASVRQIFVSISEYYPLDILHISACALYFLIFHAYAFKCVKIRGISTMN